MAGYREPCPMDALKERHRMTMHTSEKKMENFYSFILKSVFSLLSCIIWKGFLPVLLHLLNIHPVISTRNKACQAQINQLLSSYLLEKATGFLYLFFFRVDDWNRQKL